jgi:hypothetical protein
MAVAFNAFWGYWQDAVRNTRMLPSKIAGECFPYLEEFDVQVELDSHSAPLTEEKLNS